jgi:hypothetical protein
MRLALLRQGFFLMAASRLRPRQAILGVPEFERHCAAVTRSNLCHVGEQRSRTRRLTVLNRVGGFRAARGGAALTSLAGSIRGIGSSSPHRD